MIDEDKYSIKISPEVLSGDIFKVCYPSGLTYNSGCTFVYSSMTNVLSGGTNGSSLLTGLTIPILFRQVAIDLGYYSVFDGAIIQKDVVTNFVFSAVTGFPNTYYVYNTSDELINFLELSSYTIDWGDATVPTVLTTTSPDFISHNYSNSGDYTIKLIQNTPWGLNIVEKNITVPYTGNTIQNPKGTAYFISNVGSWSATPISYDFIFSGDSENFVDKQTSNNYTTTPFIISGLTNSRIQELSQYGVNKFVLHKPIIKQNKVFGVINSITTEFTGYTIDGVNYLDFSNGTSIFIANSSGLTSNWLVQEPIVKDESLLNIVSNPEVQSDIYVERGKSSVFENLERLGEINNLGNLINYGYGFYKIKPQ
jgi:hypothetical protein